MVWGGSRFPIHAMRIQVQSFASKSGITNHQSRGVSMFQIVDSYVPKQGGLVWSLLLLLEGGNDGRFRRIEENTQKASAA